MRFYNYTLWIDLLANVVILVMAVLLASELEGSSFFNEFVTDADFEAAHCRRNDTAVLAGVGPPDDAPCINAHAFEDPTAKCATMQGCYWVRDGKFYGRFCDQCVFTKEVGLTLQFASNCAALHLHLRCTSGPGGADP